MENYLEQQLKKKASTESIVIQKFLRRAWWYKLVSPALWRLRQVLEQPGLYSKTLSQKTKQNLFFFYFQGEGICRN
jgi:hypothetical protein